MITTTLARIRAHSPCAEGWQKLLRYLGKTEADDEPLPYATIVESNGLADATWCCRAEPQHSREWRLFAVWCARQVQHLMTDPRSIEAMDVAERHVHGQATDKELADAAADAWAAWGAAAMDAAARAARAAAAAAAMDAAVAAAMDAAASMDAAAAMDAAAMDAAAARADAINAQTIKFLEIVS